MILGYKHFCFEDRLSLCQLSTLEGRRLKGDLIQVFKLLKGLDQINYSNFFVLDVNISRRGQTLKIAKPRSSIVEEMAKEIRDKSDVECNLYQWAEDVPDPRELTSEKKNLIVFDDLLLKNKTPVIRIMSVEDTATLIVSI